MTIDLPGIPESQRTIFLVALGAVAYMVLAGQGKRPAWVSQLPPLHGRTNSAWRGKGSFGKAPFGPQVKR